jgi:hypothetical protein
LVPTTPEELMGDLDIVIDDVTVRQLSPTVRRIPQHLLGPDSELHRLLAVADDTCLASPLRTPRGPTFRPHIGGFAEFAAERQRQWRIAPSLPGSKWGLAAITADTVGRATDRRTGKRTFETECDELRAIHPSFPPSLRSQDWASAARFLKCLRSAPLMAAVLQSHDVTVRGSEGELAGSCIGYTDSAFPRREALGRQGGAQRDARARARRRAARSRW